jgi:hypothetical protein
MNKPTQPATLTGRRPFTMPTRPPLHFRDGCGPEQSVSNGEDLEQGPYGNERMEGNKE